LSFEDETIEKMNQIQLDRDSVERNAEACARTVAGSPITSAADTELILDQLGVLGILKARRANRAPEPAVPPLGRQRADLAGSWGHPPTPTPAQTKEGI
jgi:hypothetical protein